MALRQHNFNQEEHYPFMTDELSFQQRINALEAENKQLKNALSEFESKQDNVDLYKSIFESSDMGICLLSLPYEEPIFFNKALDELFELAGEIQSSQSFLKSITSFEDWHLIEGCISGAKKGEVRKSKWRLLHSKRAVEGIFYPVYRDNTVSHIAVYCKDSQSLHKLSGGIDDEIVENLRKEDLQKKCLEDVSQELLFPLQSFLSSASSLEALEAERETKCFNNLKLSADMLLSVADTVLDISKEDSNDLDFNFESTNLYEVGEELLSLLSKEASLKKIDLQFKKELGAFPTVKIDRRRITQVLMNLLINAINSNEKEEVTLRMTVAELSHTEARICFSVEKSQDKNPEKTEIDPSDLDWNERQKDSQLGLSISRSIIAKMGGELTLDNEAQSGERFHFTLSLEKTSEQASAKEDLHDLSKLNVLLAEDDLMNQEVAKILLKRLGILPDLAVDGRIALEMVEKKDYDIILMDMLMPRLNGLDTTRLIHEKYAGKKAPQIIAMTANTFDEEREECFEAGMQGFLAKPIILSELKEAILHAAGHSPEQQESAGKTLKRINPQNYKHINVEAIFAVSGIHKHEGGVELTRQMIGLYFDTVDQTFENFKFAFEAQDETELRRLAHSFTNAVKSIGADIMTQACNHIRKLCWEHRVPEIGNVLSLLEYENSQVIAELKRLLTELD